MLTCISKVGI